jgi:serine/threonine protein kinase
MGAAQDAGVAHGALSPSQLLVRGDGVLKVSDYGMTLAPGAGASTRPPRIAGATVGAPEYMAPEQLLGAPPDAAVDLYAAGVVLSECMVGTTPFRSESPLAFLAHKLGGSPPAGGEPGSALQEIIGRMAEPERERRLTSPAELLQLLERLG